MRLSHRIEQFVAERGRTSVRELAHWFGISDERCREELNWISPFGVELKNDDTVQLREPNPLWDQIFT
jgi:hypothetical protein